VPAFSTPGGHRRFRRDDLGEFIESTRVDSQPGPGPTVLIVDDDDERRLLVRFSLEREGCVVREAATPDAGFDDVDEAPPDLILLNAVMRDFDGWELLCRLREAHGLESIPVVMFAGQPGANTGASRATRFVRKPDPVRLVESVKQLLASAAPHS
jgi:CheY-like chemotaxis protein